MLKNKQTYIFLLISIFISSIAIFFTTCKKDRTHKEFVQLTQSYLDYHIKLNPIKASLLGIHQFDGRLDDWSAESITAKIKNLKAFQKDLLKLDLTSLSRADKIDYSILKSHLSSEIWNLEHYRIWERSPAFYHSQIRDAITTITRQTKLTEKECQNLISRLKKVPQLLAQEKANLQNSPQIGRAHV